METTINQRIKTLIDELDLNTNSFSVAIGLTNNVTIHRIINNGSNPSLYTIDAILKKYPQLSTSWLLKGEGEMWESQKPSLMSGAKAMKIRKGKEYSLKEWSAKLDVDINTIKEQEVAETVTPYYRNKVNSFLDKRDSDKGQDKTTQYLKGALEESHSLLEKVSDTFIKALKEQAKVLTNRKSLEH